MNTESSPPKGAPREGGLAQAIREQLGAEPIGTASADLVHPAAPGVRGEPDPKADADAPDRGLAEAGLADPDTASPDVAGPDTAGPDTANPDVADTNAADPLAPRARGRKRRFHIEPAPLDAAPSEPGPFDAGPPEPAACERTRGEPTRGEPAPSARSHTFVAPNLDEALAQVKRSLGYDAVILSSRRVRNEHDLDAFEVTAAKAPAEPPAQKEAPKDTFLARLLQKSGFEPGLAEALCALSMPARSLADAKRALTGLFEQNALFSQPCPPGRRTVLAFVGPTGAGKTTTLAKVAARIALVEERSVGLVTLDGYRIGATAQLEEYAELIGVPLRTAHDAATLQAALRRLADADVVLVDTAGRSPRDLVAYEELAEVLRETEEEIEQHVERCLCIPASTRGMELEEALARHACLNPGHLSLTKLDEAVRFDTLVTAQLHSALPLCWLTTGQRVPEDFEDAGPEGLAAVLCGEETYR